MGKKREKKFKVEKRHRDEGVREEEHQIVGPSLHNKTKKHTSIKIRDEINLISNNFQSGKKAF